MHRAGLVRLLALALIWGSNFLWIKVALRGLTPGQITFFRLALGALVLLAVTYARGQRLPRGVWRHLFIAALVGNVLPYLLFAYGEQLVDSAVAGVLNATTPLWTLLLATAAGFERHPGVRRMVGIGLGFVGAVIVFSPWHQGTQLTSRGGLACLLAAASYGLSYVYMARHLASRGLPVVALSAAQLSAAVVLATALFPVLDWQAPRFTADAVSAIVILGLVGTGGAYLLNYRLITDDGPSAASVVTYLLPVVAVLLGAGTLGEPLPANVIVGMVIVLVGVGLTRARPVRGQAASTGRVAPR